MDNIKVLKSQKAKYMTFFLVTALAAPTLYHSIGLKGTIYLPIFLALTVGSSFLSSAQLMALAIISPVVNMMLFNMPTGIMTYVLVFEGLAFAISTMKIKNIFANILISRISSLALIFFLSGYSFAIWKTNFVMGIPGIILNGILAIMIGKNLRRSNI